MKASTALQGTILAFMAYALLAFGDAVIKALGSTLSIFEISLFVGLFASAAVLFMRPKHERWRDVLRMKHPWLVQARALTGLGAGLLGVYAFTTIPFAEAYALIFMAPFVVIVLSTLILKERIGMLGWLAVIGGAVGALLVIRPGVRELEWGHLAALGVAICSGMTVTILRRIAGHEKRISMLGVPFAYSLVFNAIAATPGFRMPSIIELVFMAASGLLGALGQLALLNATKRSPASTVGQAQYSQLVWAVLIGAAFYHEFPDGIAVAGLIVIAMSGVATILASRGKKAATPVPVPVP
jgi:drug/metabolite transporter (DMT)-like permease